MGYTKLQGEKVNPIEKRTYGHLSTSNAVWKITLEIYLVFLKVT